jgi:DNA-binding transcriptional ArsR family regulator
MNHSSDDDDLWEAMADPTRRRLLDLLVARGHATATTLTAEMPITRQAISKHLSVLQRVGLIDSHRQGREVRYAVREQRLAEATSALSEVANRWDRRLQTIKKLAEQAHAAEGSTSAHTDEDRGARRPEAPAHIAGGTEGSVR